MRTETQGKAFPQCIFDHWDFFSGDPFEEGSSAYDLIMKVRKRKGLKIELPKLENYLDKL